MTDLKRLDPLEAAAMALFFADGGSSPFTESPADNELRDEYRDKARAALAAAVNALTMETFTDLYYNSESAQDMQERLLRALTGQEKD